MNTDKKSIIGKLINIYQRIEKLTSYLGDIEKREEMKAPESPIEWIDSLLIYIDTNLDYIEEEIYKLK